MEALSIYIYELKKGSKPCCLITLKEDELIYAIRKIKNAGFFYLIQNCAENFGEKKVNIFFGEKIYISTLKKIIKKPLNELSKEEDFMLGIILGYSIKEQCKRYCRKYIQKADLLAI